VRTWGADREPARSRHPGESLDLVKVKLGPPCLIVALFSAALLRNPPLLPARAPV